MLSYLFDPDGQVLYCKCCSKPFASKESLRGHERNKERDSGKII